MEKWCGQNSFANVAAAEGGSRASVTKPEKLFLGGTNAAYERKLSAGREGGRRGIGVGRY